jgi:hypothetical protein
MKMSGPRRLARQAGRHALVDGIPFVLPVNSEKTPALMAAFPIDPDKAAELIPGNEVHPLRLWNKALLVVTVIDYRVTDIGKYIEYSIAIGCTHGRRRAPRLLPLLMRKTFGMGQFVVDLPVSTEVSVKGGKGVWGMPKHQANLDFVVTDETVSSQYDLDGQLCMRIDMDRPRRAWIPLSMGAPNYCAFRGMLMKSYVYFKGKVGMTFGKKGAARLTIGDHPRVQPLKNLGIGADPVFTVFFPESRGMLDDYFECWFLTYPRPVEKAPEGLESVFHLGRGEDWLPPPDAPVPGRDRERDRETAVAAAAGDGNLGGGVP